MAARFFPSHQWLTYLGDHLGHMIQNWMQLWTIDNYKDSDTGILDIISLIACTISILKAKTFETWPTEISLTTS